MKKIYILDTTAITYILEAFPRKLMEDVWLKFEQQCKNGLTIANRETKKALDRELTETESIEWVSNHSEMFMPIDQNESVKLGELVDKGTFNYYNNSLSFKRRLPEAMPFNIAMAVEENRTLVTHKNCRDKKKIEKICKDNGINYISIEEYLMSIKNDI